MLVAEVDRAVAEVGWHQARPVVVAVLGPGVPIVGPRGRWRGLLRKRTGARLLAALAVLPAQGRLALAPVSRPTRNVHEGRAAMHLLTIDTEHRPGSVAVIESDDRTPDVQRTAAVLGTVGDPDGPHAQRRAEDLAARAGWLVSGAWELVADAYVALVTPAPSPGGAGPGGARP